VLLESTFIHPVDGDRQLRRKMPQKMTLAAPVTCHAALHANLVVLGCADGSLLLVDCVTMKLDCEATCAFIPSLIRVHPDRAMFIAASERGHVQAFDIALNPVRLQTSLEETSPPDLNSAAVLDTTQYFTPQMSLADGKFCQRADSADDSLHCSMTHMASNYLALRYHGGPVLMLRINGGVYGSGKLGPAQFTAEYLKIGQYHSVLLLLNELDWISQGTTILSCLNTVFNKLLKLEFSRDTEALLEMCLGLFYAPGKPIPDETLDEFSDQIHDLTRKFFHHLLRHNQMAKSFQLAVDVNDYDLFMDLYHSAKRLGYQDLADASLVKARSIFFDNSARGTPNPESYPRESTFTNPSSVKRLSIAGEIPHNYAGQHGRGREMGSHSQRYYDGETGEFSMLPSPMQLFSTSSAVTTVHVEHPPPSDRDLGNWEPLNPSNWEEQGQQIGIPEEPSLLRPQEATYAKTTSAKRISTSSFKREENPRAMTARATAYDSIVSLPKLNVNVEEGEEIKVVHFGVV